MRGILSPVAMPLSIDMAQPDFFSRSASVSPACRMAGGGDWGDLGGVESG
jgi:hypothetical protein